MTIDETYAELLRQAELLLTACERRDGGGEQPRRILECVEMIERQRFDAKICDVRELVDSFFMVRGQAAWIAIAMELLRLVKELRA